MNKFLRLTFAAAVIFGLGIISGDLTTSQRQNALRKKESDALTSARQVDVTQDVQLPELLPATGDGFDGTAAPGTGFPVVTASLEFELAEEGAGDAGVTSLLMAQEEGAGQEETRAVILQYYPDLDKYTLQGWTESYAGLQVDDIHEIMKQRQQMPDLLTEPGLQFRIEEEAATQLRPPSPDSLTHLGTLACRRNLQHYLTVGYRRQKAIACLKNPSPTESESQLTVTVTFEYQPGQRHSTRNPMHTTIADNGRLMFVLQPGDILTRNGQFSVLSDGRIGLSYDGRDYQVQGTERLPEGASQVEIRSDGSVGFMDLNDSPQTAGKIELVDGRSLGQLTSANGVYFHAALPLKVAEESSVRYQLISGTLELSNVRPELEWEMLEHFEQVEKLVR